MAPHSSTLAWKMPWMEEPGRLQSMGSLRVGHDWATLLSFFTFMHWGRKWQPTPVFLPGESQGRGSLVGCHLWGRTESDTTEVTLQHGLYRWQWITSLEILSKDFWRWHCRKVGWNLVSEGTYVNSYWKSTWLRFRQICIWLQALSLTRT